MKNTDMHHKEVRREKGEGRSKRRRNEKSFFLALYFLLLTSNFSLLT